MIGIDASRMAISARTGTERYSFELIGALARIDRQTRYMLYCNGLPDMLPALGSNFSLHNIRFARLWTHVRLSLELQRRPPDLLFVPSHVLPLLHPPDTIVTIHDLGYLAFPQAHTRARRFELHLSTLWNARAARRLIAISQATRDDLVRHYRIDPTKIHVVYHGLSASFRPVPDPAIIAAAVARYGIRPPYMLYVGTVQPRKNLVRLIEAVGMARRELVGSNGRFQIVLAGKRGWLTTEIERRAFELGIADQIHFTGYVQDIDLPALLSGARAFVFPSLYEGFGMPVLEAMACGTPVLTSTTSALPEVAGDAALLVDPHDTCAIADGLIRLASDAPLCAILRERGLARAAQFTWEHCANETRNVLNLR